MTTILATVVVLGVLILVHELGHFWAAKSVDIEVPRFSIGIGPKAVGFQWGETEYVLSWLPLGGYVRMAGMEEDEALDGIEGESVEEEREPSPRDFDAKPLWARTLVISAGVIMNFLFAVVAYGAISAIWGVTPNPEAAVGDVQEEYLPEGTFELSSVESGTRIESLNGEPVQAWRDVQMALLTSEDSTVRFGLAGGRSVEVPLPAGDSVRQVLVGAIQPSTGASTVIQAVQEGSPADSAGIRSGDRIVEVGGRAVREWSDVSRGVEGSPGQRVDVVVERDGERRRLTVVPRLNVRAAGGDTLRFGRIGVTPRLERDRLGPIAAAGHGLRETWRVTGFTLDFLGGLLTGGVSTDNLGGPIAIGQISGQAARAGVRALLDFMALLSVNLAVLNLLPIPVLDGGHLVFLGIEGIRGQPVSPEQRIRWTQAGVVVVAALMVFVIINDILRIVG